MAQQKRAVIIYSGGMDSFTLLHHVLAQGFAPDEVACLTFNYGQRHVREIEAAKTVCQGLKITHKIVDISAINTLMAGSSLTDDIEIPEGHYAEESMKSTVVPNRNMVLLSMAVAYAVSLEAPAVYYGAHSGDHAIYPDCRPEFVQKMKDVCAIANYDPVSIETPFLHHTKGEILAVGKALALDYSNTWTCYNGRTKACGKCGACVERLEAFAENQLIDPLEYE
ncbi:7-cyano-7-deazaguanine synthase QueC [Alteromonas sp. LMIT006]|uniref:7-cyano-7-deazaguanine synthase QueC n=1 Tax=Alteromonadaceae TaxID=72275 RepID=UPI0020CA3B7A|nr:7-cyano-7-deazaguanine synthase QueC [Alteromonas sp. LMIT006]UTP71799.1 7-cyano-7-deazaguanine synthase QueC [Alteromonas sp. LMIT006]